MIKIKRISTERFHKNLKYNAVDCGHELKVFSANKYRYSEPGFYYHIKNGRITIYYETGAKSKSGGITLDKSLMLCWEKNFFGRNFLFSMIVGTWFMWPCFLLIIAFSVFFRDSVQTIIFDLLSAVILLFFMQFGQKLKLLNFIDEICSK